MSTCMLNMEHIVKLRNTSKELVDFVLHSTRLQDRTGKCYAVYYKDTVEELGVCNQTFYNNLRQAEALGILKIYWDEMKTSQDDWDYRLINSNIQFSDSGEASMRYLNTNVDFLYTGEFKELKLNEKILILYLLALKDLRDGKEKILTFKRLLQYAGIKHISLLMRYLESLKKFFKIIIKEGHIIIGLLPRLMVGRNSSNLLCKTTANKLHARHLINNIICRKTGTYRDSEDPDYERELDKTAELLVKYYKNSFDLVFEEIYKACDRHKLLIADYISDNIIARMAANKRQK